MIGEVMKKLLILPLAAGLSACQYLPWTDAPPTRGPVAAMVTIPPKQEPEPKPEPKPVGPVVEREGKSFVLPDEAQTARRDLFRLVDALERAYRVLAYEPPYPKIHIVSRRHSALERGAIAAAVIDAVGKEYLYFERRYLRRGYPIDGLVVHELAHLQAWRIHGVDVPKHGKEFKDICRLGASVQDCAAERE